MNTVMRALASLIVAVAMSGAVPAVATAQVPTGPTDPLLNQGPKAVATGERVMISTQLASVTEAALRVLRDGGNAADAAITATLLQNVQDFHQVHLFGSMAGIYYEAASGKYYAFNGYIERPRADRCGDGDPSRVALGGKMSALKEIAARFGTRPWESYFAPAIAAAEEGVLVTSFMYGSNYSGWDRGDLIQKNPAAREFYMPEGHLVPVGHRWKMPALAETLRKVRDQGPDYMITGEFVRRFIEVARARGGCVSIEDYEDYEVIWQEPLRFSYRGHEIITEPPPVAGGLMLGYSLNMLENFPLKEGGHYATSSRTLEIMARAQARAEEEVRWSIADPRSFNVPSELWLSKDYGRFGAEFVRQTTAKVNLAPSRSAPESYRQGGGENLGRIDQDESNHNVIVDAEGNWITYLHTGHGGMPGVFIDGVRATGSGRWTRTTGPGRRGNTHITATLVAKDGVPWMALGSPGRPSQPVTQVLVSLIDFGMHPREAVDAPRFFAYQTLGPTDASRPTRDFGNLVSVQIESRIPRNVRQGLSERGIMVFDQGPYNWHLGSMQIVWRDMESRMLFGTSDPRRLGHAAGF